MLVERRKSLFDNRHSPKSKVQSPKSQVAPGKFRRNRQD
jgi:hypothetical protein